MTSTYRLSLALPVTFALLWASSYVTSRIGLDDISPLLFVAIRLVMAAPVMLLLCVTIMREAVPAIGHWPHLLVGGALVHGVTLCAAHVALQTLDAAPLALVHAFHPVLTAALAVPLLKERFTARQWIGMGLGLIGVLLVFPLATADSKVVAMVLLSLFGLTGGTLYLKRFSPQVGPFSATAVQFVGGAVLSVLAVVLLENPVADWTPSLIAVMAWNTALISIVGMTIYSLMLMRGEAGRAASAFFIVPGSAALMGWIFLNQTLSVIGLAGLLLASFGVWLVWRRQA
ncbi:MAG: DMT family transporter [Hyphomicrobiaceae bacterium]|nr:DMT family transporter [Hyphomicrobiaceae bacterium]